MLISKSIVLAGVISLTAAIGCANADKAQKTETQTGRTSFSESSEGHDMTKSAAREAGAHNFVEIEFSQGSSLLSDNAKSSLQAVLSEARQAGKIDEVIVLAWSDEEYPSKSVGKLLNFQRKLAENRNKAIKAFVMRVKNVDVDSYNMAERPGALSELFSTADSELKGSMLAAGIPTTADNLQYPSKASHAVVFVKVQ